MVDLVKNKHLTVISYGTPSVELPTRSRQPRKTPFVKFKAHTVKIAVDQLLYQ